MLKKLQAAPEDMELFRKLAEENNQDAETKDALRRPALLLAGAAPRTRRAAQAVRDAAFALGEDRRRSRRRSSRASRASTSSSCTGERAALDRSLEDARRLIQNRLWRKKREDAIEKFVADLRTEGRRQGEPRRCSVRSRST